MRAFRLATGILLAVVTVMAQTPMVIVCKGDNAKPCTARQVDALSDAVTAGRAHHDVLVGVKSISLASSDGTLNCVQNDGKPCTVPQLDQIKLIATDQKLYLNYHAGKPKTGK